jgi:hypothetical protein
MHIRKAIEIILQQTTLKKLHLCLKETKFQEVKTTTTKTPLTSFSQFSWLERREERHLTIMCLIKNSSGVPKRK